MTKTYQYQSHTVNNMASDGLATQGARPSEAMELTYRLSRIFHFQHQKTDIGEARIWWRHQMETFSALLALCAGKSPVTGEFPSQRPVTRRWSFDVFLHLCLNKRLSKQSWGWWFETPSHSLWCHCNDIGIYKNIHPVMADWLIDWYIGLNFVFDV